MKGRNEEYKLCLLNYLQKTSQCSLSPEHLLMRLFSVIHRLNKSHRGTCTYRAHVSNMLNTRRLQLFNRRSPFDLTEKKKIYSKIHIKYTSGMLKTTQIKVYYFLFISFFSPECHHNSPRSPCLCTWIKSTCFGSSFNYTLQHNLNLHFLRYGKFSFNILIARTYPIQFHSLNPIEISEEDTNSHHF